LGLDLPIKTQAPTGALRHKEKNHACEKETNQETQEGQEDGTDQAALAQFLEGKL
jgi:hypothetical protein